MTSWREADQKIAALEQQVQSFDGFHGYFRSGYGLNSVTGGQQVAFQAPGAERKIPTFGK